ncbi:MAG: phosphoglycolate phosphatase, partial [Acidobacteria bacterium]|nr:phosphoglycolate phosphatase [Acidobacteriota bacterium]
MQLVIFDLDGTLVDSVRDLCEAVNATRLNLGLDPLPYDTVASYVGNGAPVLIRRAMGPQASDQTVADALAYFLSYYREHMLDHTRPYPGVVETLEQLHQQRVRMAVLTNKPERFSRDMCAGLGLGKYFFQIYGGNSFEQKKPDPIGIHTLMQECGARPENTIMVGDSHTDILTARNAGVRSVGVTYGISPETHKDTPPDRLIASKLQLPPVT